MCKIFALTNATNVKVTDKLLNVLKTIMCKYDNDAFGYAAQGAKGVFGERTTDTNLPFRSRHLTPSPIEDMPFIKKRYNRFGVSSPIVGSFIAHARLSTNNKAIECAHPYVGKKYTLIHNGVVTDEAVNPIDTVTENDTEILLRYIERDGLKGVEQNVSGYYALAMLDNSNKLHIVRDDVAKLYMAVIDKLNTSIIATTPDIIHEVCKEMKWKHSPIEAIMDNIYLIFEGNEVVEFRSISPREPSYVNTFQAARALGFNSENGYRDSYYENMHLSSDDKEALNAEIKALEKKGEDTVDVYDHMMRKVRE